MRTLTNRFDEHGGRRWCCTRFLAAVLGSVASTVACGRRPPLPSRQARCVACTSTPRSRCLSAAVTTTRSRSGTTSSAGGHLLAVLPPPLLLCLALLPPPSPPLLPSPLCQACSPGAGFGQAPTKPSASPRLLQVPVHAAGPPGLHPHRAGALRMQRALVPARRSTAQPAGLTQGAAPCLRPLPAAVLGCARTARMLTPAGSCLPTVPLDRLPFNVPLRVHFQCFSPSLAPLNSSTTSTPGSCPPPMTRPSASGTGNRATASPC